MSLYITDNEGTLHKIAGVDSSPVTVVQETGNDTEVVMSQDAVTKALEDKVNAEEGKSLSTNDFTNIYKQNVEENTSKSHTHTNKQILDATTASYTSEEKTKLNSLSNYDDTEVKTLISSESQTRQNAVDTLQGEIDSSNENISDLYNVVDKNVVTDATVAETTSQANITLTKTNISSGATSTKTVSIPSATGSQAGLLSAEDQTIAGAKTFTAPEYIRETEQVTTKFKTSNGGTIIIGKEGKNSGTMLKFEQTEGTTRLRFRGSNAAGAMIWEQPEQGAQLYFDLGEQGVDYKRILMPSSAGTLALTSQIPTNYVTTNTEQTVAGKKTFSSDVTIGGNLNVTGTTTINGTDIDTYIKDKTPSFTYDSDTKTLTITT